VYRIVVQGLLEERFSDRLAGMGIRANGGPGGGDVTTLVGYLQDQAQLIGVMNALYELHLPILSVENIGCAQTDRL
jgi:hypothetical protein